MNVGDIFSMLGLNNKPFLDGIAEAGAATDKFAQGVSDVAASAGDELQALSDRLKTSLSVPGGWKNISDEDAFAGIKAGFIGADSAFHEYQKDVEGGLDSVGRKAKDTADRAAAEADKINQAWGSNLTKALQLAQGAFATFITSIPIYGVVKESTEAIVGFDAALVGMQAHTLLTSNAIQGLGVYASYATENLSQFHELDAIAGLQMLARAGEDVATSMRNLPAVLNLAAVAGMDVATAADAVTTTMSQFNMSTMDAARVADVYTKASQMSKVSTSELASMFRYMAATMDGAGYSFEETTTYVTAFAQAGLMARQASGALSTAIQSLADMNAAGQEVLDRYGVALKDATGKVRPLIDIVLQLKNAGASTTDMLSVFGASSQKITTVLANLGKDGFDKLVKGLEDSKGAAKDAAGILQTSLASSLETTHKSLADIWLSLGKDMKPALQWFMAAINGLLDLVKKAVQSIEGWSTAHKALVGTFIGLSAVIIPLMLLINNFTKGIGLLKVALMDVGVVGGPFTAIAIAVAVVTAAVIAGITKWKEYQSVMNPIFAGLPTDTNIIKAKDKLTQFDIDTAKGVGAPIAMGNDVGWGSSILKDDPAYLKDRADQRVKLAKDVNDRIAANNGAARDAWEKGTADQARQAKIDADAVNNEKLATIKTYDDEVYKLKHTAYQSEMVDINNHFKEEITAYEKTGMTTAQATAKANEYRVAAIADLDKRTAAGTAKLADAASKANDATVKKNQEANDAIVASQAAAQSALDQITMDTTQYALKQLKILMAEWRANGVSEVTIAAYSAQEKKVIWGDYSRAVTAINEKAAADAKDLAEKAADAAKKIQDDYLSALSDYTSKQGDVRDGLSQIIIGDYEEEKRVAVNDLNTERDTGVNTLNDMITARQDKLTFDLDAIGQEKTDAVNALDAERDAAVNALDDMITARQDELSSTLDAIDKELDATVNALNGMIDARQTELTTTLDAISQEKDAVLGQYDEQIQALQDSHTIAQDAVTVNQLETNVIYATTAKGRTDAQAALDKFIADESFNTQLASLQKQKQAASDTFDDKTTAAKKAGDAEIQTLKDTLAVTKTSYAAMTLAAKDSGDAEIRSLKDTLAASQSSYAGRLTATNSYYDQTLAAITKSGNFEIKQLQDALTAFQKSEDDRLKSINTFYDQKLATENINADLEKLLATKTSDEILKMLRDRLPLYANIGAQYGNALYGAAENAYNAVMALMQTAIPIAPATVQVQANGMAPPGYPVDTIVETANGNYKITGVNQATPSGYTSVPVSNVMPSLGGGGGTRSLMAHAEGGYFTTPHVGMVAEKGPEYVVPADQASAFAKQMGGSNDSLLRQLLLKVDTLTFAVRQVAPGVGSAVNGLGRA